jgi:hypothetical protein
MNPAIHVPLFVKTTTLAIASGVTAVASTLLTFRFLRHFQVYQQFAVGSLAWSGDSKAGEVYAALIFIVTLPAAWYLLRWASEAYSKMGVGQQALVWLQASCLPAAIWAGQILLNPEWGSGWLQISLLLIGYWLVASIMITVTHSHRAKSGTINEAFFYLSPSYLFFFPILSGFSLLGALIALNRGLLWNPLIPAWPTGFCIGAILLFYLLFYQSWTGRVREKQLWGRLLVCAQLGIPFLAAGLIPTPYLQDGTVQRTTTISTALVVLVFIIGIVAVWDLLRRFRKAIDGPEGVSLFAVFLCVWIIKNSFTPLPSIPQDDWHFGEVLIPFFSWYDFGAIPFADIMPVRGFISVINAAVGHLFFDGTAAAIFNSSAIIGFLFSGLLFFPLSLSAGPAAAAFAVLALSNLYNFPIGQPDYLFAAAFSLVCYFAQRQNHAAAVITWLVFNPIYLLLSPGYSLLFIVASMPLVGYCVCRSGFSGLRRISAIFFGIGIACFLMLTTPMGVKIVQGIWHYVNDHAAVNVIGHGIAWNESMRNQKGAPAFLELLRSSALLVAAVMLIRFIDMLWQFRPARIGGMPQNAVDDDDKLDSAISSSIVLTVIVFLPRVLGRIDPNEASRLGSLTLLVLAGLSPLILHRFKNQLWVGLLVLMSAIIVSGVNLKLFTPLNSKALLIPQYINADRQRLEDYNESGIRHIGNAHLESDHRQRLFLLKQSIDTFLPAEAPYYDLSNRNAQYIYLGKRVPADWSGPYYLADERAQERVAAQLSSQKVPLLLLKADNIEHDGGTVALRAYWLYRFILSTYVPFRLNGFIFAVHRDDAEQERFKSLVFMNPQETMGLFEEAFTVTNLHGIPLSWGKSVSTLQSRFEASHLQLNPSVGSDRKIMLSSSNDWESNKNATEGSYDLLKLRLKCDDQAENEANLSWNGAYHGSIIKGESRFSAGTGTLLVPVGAYPAWILSERRSEVTLDFSAKTCLVLEAELLKRVTPRPIN